MSRRIGGAVASLSKKNVIFCLINDVTYISALDGSLCICERAAILKDDYYLMGEDYPLLVPENLL